MLDTGLPSAASPFASPGQLLVVFFLVWTGIILLAMVLFGRAGKAVWKRRAWLPFNVASGLIFVAFVWVMGFPASAVGLAD
jgi:hypothetical protein